MKTPLAALCLGAILAAAPAAQAAPAMLHQDGVTGPEIAKWLQDAGYKAKLGTDKVGDPMVSSASEGVSFEVYFYDCEEKPRCRAIQFTAGFDKDKPMSPAKINEWNRDHRYLKAHLDAEGDPYVNYDVNVNAGRTQAGLDDDFQIWIEMLSDFAEFIDW